MSGAQAGWPAWRAALLARVGDLATGRDLLDEATRRRALLVVADDLAAMVAGAGEPQVAALSVAAGRVAPAPEAGHVTGGRSGRAWAALVNATAANWNELDEGYRPATCHGGLYALPAAMAEAEATGGSLDDVLRALVAGYEVATGFARAMPAPRPLALHPHATLSPVGAAAAVAALRGAGGDGIGAAADVAVTLAAAGPFEHAARGLLVRNAWAGHGAMSGFTAVELAAAGLGAGDDAAVAVLGRSLGQPVDPAELASRPRRWAIHDGYHKAYACCQYLHSAVEAALGLATGPLAGVAADDVVGVEVATHPLAMPLIDPEPSTVLGGQFSMPHAVAAVLARREATSATFSADHLDDPSVARIRRLVTLVPFGGDLRPPHDRPARVTVTTADGRSVAAECLSAVGSPDRPLDEADVLAKAARLTAAAAPGFAAVATDLLAGRVPGQTPWADVLARLWAR